MKRKKTIAILGVLAMVGTVLAVRWFSFTGAYVAWFGGVEPLGGGYYLFVLHPDGTGFVGQSREYMRPFTYKRTESQLEVQIAWNYAHTDTYVFAVAPLRLEAMGRRLPNGSLTKDSGYGYLMRGTYDKKPI